MKRRMFIRFASAAACAVAFACTLHAAEGVKRPNIILMMADDLSSKDMACYGNPGIPTPTLSRLAEDGVSFQTCWATPICSPSRAQIMTGRYGFRTHWFHNSLKNKDSLASRQLTIGQVFKNAGYATAVVGKLQLPGTTKDHGFDEEYMWLGGHGLWGTLRSQFDGPVEGQKQKGKRGGLPGRPARYWHPAIVQNGNFVKTTKPVGSRAMARDLCPSMTTPTSQVSQHQERRGRGKRNEKHPSSNDCCRHHANCFGRSRRAPTQLCCHFR